MYLFAIPLLRSMFKVWGCVMYVFVVPLLCSMFKEICETSPSNNIVFSSDGTWHPNTEGCGTCSLSYW